MKASTAAEVADVYARSLLAAAKESGTAAAVAADLELVATVLTREPELRAFLTSPYVSVRAKRDLLQKAFTGRLHPITVHFLRVTIGRRREALMPAILDRYRQLYHADQGYETVKVTVAQDLSREQLEKLSHDLAEAMKARIHLEVQVDPSLLGGVIIRRGDRVLDNSIRGRLLRTVEQIAKPERRNRKRIDEG